jgi:hypothetical protein
MPQRCVTVPDIRNHLMGFAQTAHAFPAGNSVILREDEPASIIAFALRCVSPCRLLVGTDTMASSTALWDMTTELRDPTRIRKLLHPPLSQVTSPRLDQSIFGTPATTDGARTPSTARGSRSGSPDANDGKPVARAFTDSVEVERSDEVRQARSKLTSMASLGKRSSADTVASRVFAAGLRAVTDPMSLMGLSSEATIDSGIDGLPAKHKMARSVDDDGALLDRLLTSTEPAVESIAAPVKPTPGLPKLIASLAGPSKPQVTAISATADVVEEGLAPSAAEIAKPRRSSADEALAELLVRPASSRDLPPLFPDDESDEQDEGEEADTMSSLPVLPLRRLDSASSLGSTASTATLAPPASARTSFLPRLFGGFGSLGRQRPGALSRSMSVQGIASDTDPVPHLRYSAPDPPPLRLDVVVDRHVQTCRKATSGSRLSPGMRSALRRSAESATWPKPSASRMLYTP